MTSIEWLVKELYTEMNMSGDGRVLDEILEEARHKHKQEMGDTWDAAIFRNAQRGYNASRTFEDFDDYYQETFVSKGSDETPMERKLLKSGFVDVVPKHPSVISQNGNELLFDKEGNLIKELPQQEISDDQAIKLLQDMNKQPMRFHCVPKEISDEEIEKAAAHHEPMVTRRTWISACKWYREQLKQRQ
jgi:hypothetical protein